MRRVSAQDLRASAAALGFGRSSLACELIALEPRMVFDGAAAATVAATTDTHGTDHSGEGSGDAGKSALKAAVDAASKLAGAVAAPLPNERPTIESRDIILGQFNFGGFDGPGPKSTGVLVSSLVGPRGAGDGAPANMDDPEGFGGGYGIAITGLTGQWYYRTGTGAWTAISAADLAGGKVLLLDSKASLFCGSGKGDSLTVKAWDKTSGTSGTYVTRDGAGTSISDGETRIVATFREPPALSEGKVDVSRHVSLSPSSSLGLSAAELLAKAGLTGGTGTASGIAITGSTGAGGDWWYTTDKGATWNRLSDALAGGKALLLNADGDTRLAYTGLRPADGSKPTLSFRAWDRAGQAGLGQGDLTNGSTVDVAVVRQQLAVGKPFSDRESVASLDLTNDPPVIDPVAPLATFKNNSVDGRITASDPDGDPLTYSLKTQAGHGKVSIDEKTGRFSYAPGEGFVGKDSFVVVVSDGRGGTSEITVTVTVDNRPPEAPGSASVSTPQDTQVTKAINASDPDKGDTLRYELKPGGGPSNGLVTFDQTKGTFTYTPRAGFTGSDTLVITITDGMDTVEQTVTVTVTPTGGGGGGGDTVTAVDYVPEAAPAERGNQPGFQLAGLDAGPRLTGVGPLAVLAFDPFLRPALVSVVALNQAGLPLGPEVTGATAPPIEGLILAVSTFKRGPGVEVKVDVIALSEAGQRLAQRPASLAAKARDAVPGAVTVSGTELVFVADQAGLVPVEIEARASDGTVLRGVIVVDTTSGRVERIEPAGRSAAAPRFGERLDMALAEFEKTDPGLLASLLSGPAPGPVAPNS